MSSTELTKKIDFIRYLSQNHSDESEIPENDPFPFEVDRIGYDDLEFMKELEKLGFLGHFSFHYTELTDSDGTPTGMASGEVEIFFTIKSKTKLIDYLCELERQERLQSGKQPFIRPKTLQNIAQWIGALDTGTNLIHFLNYCGVKKDLIEYPQTKWRMVFSILNNLVSSNAEEDHKILFIILKEICHPTMHQGDEKRAEEFKQTLNDWLRYDGLSIDNECVLGIDISEERVKTKKLEQDRVHIDSTAIFFDHRRQKLVFCGRPFHKFVPGKGPSEIFKKAFNGKIFLYEVPHEKITTTTRQEFDKIIQDFREDIKKKLKRLNAPSNLFNDFFVRLDGPNIIISKVFVLLDKPLNS